MDVDDIFWHDSVIKKVIELPEKDAVLFEIDYPVNWGKDEYEVHTLAFSGVRGYEIHEGPFFRRTHNFGRHQIGAPRVHRRP